MADVVSPQKRSEMMAGIRGKNTKPEQFIRKALHRKGYRYRIHAAKLPGKPDLVLPKYNAVIIVHGCFWHGHDCHLFKWPQSRTDFWKAKITKNRENDAKALNALEAMDWRILTVWECALKGKERLEPDQIIDQITCWLHSDDRFCEIRGRNRSEIAKEPVQRNRRSRKA